tara:strand:+ start:2832 stop:3647 length:816 start_codon:yes stop_codon:yes gene_type:complete
MDNNNSDSNKNSDGPKSDRAYARLERLSRYSSGKQKTSSAAYTSFIRRMRLILPLVAVSIVAALLAWPDNQNQIAILEKSQKESLKTVRKNELTNPKFESIDDKNQPYSITAEKAVQGESDEEAMLLEKPLADMQLKSGSWIALKANQGTYWQKEEKLNLQKNVTLFHDDGYEMNTDILFIDLKNQTVQSNTDVHGHGPAGTLTAKGLDGNNTNGILIFHGPATLILKNAGSLQGLTNAQDTAAPIEGNTGSPNVTDETLDITIQPDINDE